MNIKEEIVSVEITNEELGRIVAPHLSQIGFELSQIDEAEIKMVISETGEINTVNGVIIRYKRVRK